MAGNWGKWWTSGTKNCKWGTNMVFYWQMDGKWCKSRGIRLNGQKWDCALKMEGEGTRLGKCGNNSWRWVKIWK